MMRRMEGHFMITLRTVAVATLAFTVLAAGAVPAGAHDGPRGRGHGDHQHWRGPPPGQWVHPQYGPSYWAPPPVRYRPAPVYVAPPVVYPPPVMYYPAVPAYPVYPGYPGYAGPRGGVSLGVQIPLY